MKNEVLVAILLAVGFLFIFKVNVLNILYDVIERIRKMAEAAGKERSKSLKQILAEEKGEVRLSMHKRTMTEANRMLEVEGQAHSIRNTKRTCYMLGSIGLLIAFIMKNIFLAPVLASLLYFIPLWIIKYRSADYQKQTLNELETTLSIITSTYMRTDNIVLAVEENLPFMNEPIKSAFDRFYTEATYINADINACLKNLQKCYSNEVFQEWCNAILSCQKNNTMKATLQQTLSKFADIREIQYEYDTEIRTVMKDHVMLTMGVVAALPLFYFINKSWVIPLVTTTVGKIVLTLFFLTILFATDKALNLSEPLDIQEAQKKK